MYQLHFQPSCLHFQKLFHLSFLKFQVLPGTNWQNFSLCLVFPFDFFQKILILMSLSIYFIILNNLSSELSGKPFPSVFDVIT